ncbi:chitinase [Actinoallomurus sp. NBC_01490]|uniref:chitinase n=1 Tax=Actinoallomurus sp. NBC_01490 TaxID=2903557 RepID=UPI002E32FC39|nr:chitinase [Actinoallomurus sp. NBC_01490]
MIRLFAKLAAASTKFVSRRAGSSPAVLPKPFAARVVPAGLLAGLALAPAVLAVGPSSASAATGNWPSVSPYVDMGAWPTPSLTQMSQASGIKGFTLGFVTGTGCKASWFNAYDPRTAWQKDEIAALRSAGGDVRISFGGASGIELAQACSSVDALYTEYAAVVDAYGAKYADFDIEGAATADSASISRRSQALARLKQTHPNLKISLTLPVLPEGLTADGLNVVTSAKNAGAGPDAVNVMAMDYYRSGTDDGDAATQAAQSTHDQLKTIFTGKSDAQIWAMVGVTPMLGKNDDGSVYDQSDARRLVSFAGQHHIGTLGFWEETRDRNACNGALYQCTNIPQQPYEFSKIFAAYTG